MPSQETYGSRLRKYERRERLILWVGAGLLGLIALAAGDMAATALADAPDFLVAAMLTFIVLSGAFLAMARVNFEWEATLIQRHLDDGMAANDDPLPVGRWPQKAEIWWNLAFSSIIVAGLLFLAATWWAALN